MSSAPLDGARGPDIPSRDRPPRAGWSAWGAPAVLLVVSAALVLLLDRWLTAQFDDGRAALLVSILMTTGFASFLSMVGHPHARSRS